MLKVTEKLDGDSVSQIHDELVLTWDQRKRGRLRALTHKQQDIGLFLERGKVLRDGEHLRAETGEVIRVIAAEEPVVTASCEDPLVFARICYHLGNRHVPLQIGTGWVRFQPDYVLEDLVKLYGLQVVQEEAPFDPENGAYGDHGGHGHSHAHDHSHDHDHDHGHPFVRLSPLPVSGIRKTDTP